MDKSGVYCLCRGRATPNVRFSPGGPTLPRPLSADFQAATAELREGAASGLDETDVGVRELQGNKILAPPPMTPNFSIVYALQFQPWQGRTKAITTTRSVGVPIDSS